MRRVPRGSPSTASSPPAAVRREVSPASPPPGRTACAISHGMKNSGRYRDKLARVKQICDEHGMRFRVIFKDQIWLSIVHRRNVTLFASRAFTSIRPEHRHRLEKHRSDSGGVSTFGELVGAIEPENPRYGEAIVQALTVARQVKIDLTKP